MLKISCADCLSLSPAVSMRFTLKMCLAAWNQKKNSPKPLISKGSKSLEVIDVDTLKKNVAMLVMISSMSLDFWFGYLVGRAPKLGHRTDRLWCVSNLSKVVTWECSGQGSNPRPRGHWVRHNNHYTTKPHRTLYLSATVFTLYKPTAVK